MSATVFLKSKEFTKLINKGKDQSFLTPEDINDAIPASLVSPEDLDMILFKIHDNKIDVQSEVNEEDDIKTEESVEVESDVTENVIEEEVAEVEEETFEL